MRSLPILGLLICLSLSLTAPARAQAVREQLFPEGIFWQMDSHAAFVLMPEEKLRSHPQPWVFYAPTLSAYPDKHEEWMHRQLLSAGIAIAGVDVGEAYGSPSSRQVFDTFYDRLVKERNFSPKPVLLGRSRGGLWVSSWACDHPDRFAGLAGIYPVYDWRTYPGVEKAATAYGLTTQQLIQGEAELNPVARLPAIAKAGLPVFIIHGDQDSVVPLGPNSQALLECYRAHAVQDQVQLEVVVGQGHNFWEGFFRSQRLVDFVIKHARAPGR